MSVKNINEMLQSEEYNFLRDDPNLGDNIILLGYGGSHAYGTNNEDSDVDIRGIATNSKRNILTGQDFEQVVDVPTDTTVYSFDKIIKLLCSCNPNVIELLGLKPEHYFRLTNAGRLLVENRHLFLSKRAVYTFGSYANSQFRRLENKSARMVDQTQREKHILSSIEHAYEFFKERYARVPEDSLKLYVDKTDREGYDSEIFCDVNLVHYPLRDHKSMFSDMQAIISGYNKIGKRNEKAIQKDKLNKHATHLIRLYLMAFDILEKGEINTYREKEHDFLMDIRNGKYLDGNKQIKKELYDIVDEYENRLNKLKVSTTLPEVPDMNKIMKLVEQINYEVVVA